MSTRWRRVRTPGAASRVAPTIRGVYAFGEVEAIEGLPVGMTWRYVGRSQNLRQRLGQHAPLLETNPDLRDWLACHHDTAELWFASTATNAEARALEMRLVRALKPTFNKVTFKKERK